MRYRTHLRAKKAVGCHAQGEPASVWVLQARGTPEEVKGNLPHSAHLGRRLGDGRVRRRSDGRARVLRGPGWLVGIGALLSEERERRRERRSRGGAGSKAEKGALLAGEEGGTLGGEASSRGDGTSKHV